MKNTTPTPAEIKTTRTQAALTQREAAARVYASQRQWENWEQGINKMPTGLWVLFQDCLTNPLI